MIERRDFLGAGVAGMALAMADSALARPRPAADAAGAVPSRATLLDSDWRFHLGHAADLTKDFGFGLNQRTYAKAGWMTAEASRPAFDDSGWAAVQLPHDWAVDLPYAPPATPASKATEDAVAAHGFKAIGRDHPENSVGWYRRAIAIEPGDRDRRLWLEFDGVFRDCLVFVNGYIATRNESGYAPFRVDIDDFLDYSGGPNVIAVRVDASLGEGWFYEGAGIYRHVHLVRTGRVHIPQWGTCVRTVLSAAGATVQVATDIANDGPAAAAVTVRQRVRGPGGGEVARFDDIAVTVAAEQNATVDASARVAAPLLWSIETPHLYTLESEVIVGGAVVDRFETPFGIRTIQLDAARGFLLNGKPVKLLGTCNHQDHAGVGTAIPDRLHAWRVEQLQSMGSNAWRSAHNPPATALLDICDAKGMLMMVEARLNSTAPDAIDQLDRIVRSARNHPSVFMWSVGNEEPHQATERGARISAEMVRRVKVLDPTRPTIQAFDNGFGKGASRVVDAIGFNYRTDKIEAFHAEFPDQPVIGTETGSTVATRGEYRNDPARHIVRAYDTEHPWWASTAEEWWSIAADRPYIAGGFVWTGFDYRGEPTPFAQWPSVNSYFGILDLCGFAKDNYWYYRAWWRPDQPMVHLLPHWNWPGHEGQPVEVWAHGNCDEIELVVNGQSAGRKAMPRNRHLAWSVPYAPGRIEACGYNRGKLVARDRRETTGPAAALRLVTDRRGIDADGRDLAMIRVEAIDAAGRVVPTADVPVTFALEGPARLIGVGNGDPTSTESDKGPLRSTFNGLCQAIVQSGGDAGVIRVSAASPALYPASIGIVAARTQ